MESLKNGVHRITDHLQLVLAYLELEQYPKALAQVREAIVDLRKIAIQVSGLMVVRRMPRKSVVVVPHGTRTVSSDDVKIDVPKDAVTILPESDVLPGHGKDNKRSK
jgi:hypothetical protein